MCLTSCTVGEEGSSTTFSTVGTTVGSATTMTSANDSSGGGESGTESSGGEQSEGEASTSGEAESGPADSSGGMTCGDGTKDPVEMCDGTDVGDQSCAGLGLGGGPLGCMPDCSDFDTSGCMNQAVCGNGIKDGTEQCDGADLGGQNCTTLGFDMGALSCSATCQLNTSQCEDMICTPDFGDCSEVPCCPGSFCYPVDGNTCGPEP